jgi:hypothetical protein
MILGKHEAYELGKIRFYLESRKLKPSMFCRLCGAENSYLLRGLILSERFGGINPGPNPYLCTECWIGQIEKNYREYCDIHGIPT